MGKVWEKPHVLIPFPLVPLWDWVFIGSFASHLGMAKPNKKRVPNPT